MKLTLFSLACLCLSVSAVKIKVANTMGPNTGTAIGCFVGDKSLQSITDLKDGKDFVIDFTPDCDNDAICSGPVSNDGKGATFTICKGCDCGDAGFFLRGDGIYKGGLNGENIVKIGDFN